MRSQLESGQSIFQLFRQAVVSKVLMHLTRQRRLETQVNRRHLAVESILILVIVLTFNFYHHWSDVVLSGENYAVSIPILETGYGAYLPLLNIWLFLALLANGITFREGRWTDNTRLAALVIGFLAMPVLLLLINADPIITLNPTWSAARTAAGYSLVRIEEQFLPVLGTGMRLSLIVSLIVMLTVTFQRLAFYLLPWWLSARTALRRDSRKVA